MKKKSGFTNLRGYIGVDLASKKEGSKNHGRIPFDHLFQILKGKRTHLLILTVLQISKEKQRGRVQKQCRIKNPRIWIQSLEAFVSTHAVTKFGGTSYNFLSTLVL